MAIRLEKKYILDISQQNVWEAILDPETLAEILPNCKSLDPIGDHKFDANIEIKIGPIKGQFKSKLSLFDLDPPNGYKFDVNGDGSKGQMRGAGEILLTSMDTDGVMDGFAMSLTRAVADVVNVPVIASGGAGRPNHFADILAEGGAAAALAASVFHDKVLTINQVKQYVAQRGVPVRLQ